jgi:serine O-acetyltransferase
MRIWPFENLISDINRLRETSDNSKCPISKLFKKVFINPNFYVVVVYRFSSFLYRMKIPLIPQFISFLSDLILGTSIPSSCEIGKGFLIPHRQCIVITGDAIIGEHVTIFQGVTIGGNGKKADGTPHIGNNVKIFAGAKVLGPIIIEDNSIIAANSVVLISVPMNSVAAGVPAKVKKIR